MNHFRFRLVLATAALTAALTVLGLKMGGFLNPAISANAIQLVATNQVVASGVSPYQIYCEQQLAMLVLEEQANPSLRLHDPLGRLVRCKASADGVSLLLFSTGKYQ